MTSLPAAVLWDLDGTLIDTEPYWIRCEQQLVASYGGQWTDEDAQSVIGSDLMDTAEVLRSRGGVPLRPLQIIDRLMDGVAALMRERMPWRPGSRELLAALKLRGVPCALVTMSWKKITDVVLPHLPPGSFQAVITGEMVMNGKPHPEPYRRAAEELGVDPLSCIAIEDSPTGVASAEGAGCVVVAVEHLVPIPPARHRVMLTTLEGITPEVLGEFVETTPPPPVPPTGLETTQSRYKAGFPAPSDSVSIQTRGFGRWSALGGRWRILGALAAALILLAGGIWWFAIRDTGPKYDPGPFNVHAWVPGWELDDAVDEFAPRANLFHQVSPFWYQVTGLTTIQFFDQTDEERVADFLDQAGERGVPLVPTLTDGTAPGVLASILADPKSRTQHVDAIVAFAAEHDFDGVDLNYENFAFDDGRDTWATTRPNWVVFVTELSDRLHADGRLLTVSVPPVYDDERTEDSGYWVYDYGGIVDHVDAIRIMAYDFSTSDPGPISPLDWIRDIIDGSTDAAGGPEKLVLGIPMFGRNWVIATIGECPASAEGTVSHHLNAIPDLIERRAVDPIYNQETGEWSFTYQLPVEEGDESCTQTREVHYLDAEGTKVRMEMSIDAGFLGVALFAFTYEDEAVWTNIEEINATLPTTTMAADATTAPSTTTATTVATTSQATTTTAGATTTTT